MNATRKRLLYKATHRGTKEADKIIGGYAEAYLDAMTEDVLASFDRLLDESDHALSIGSWAQNLFLPTWMQTFCARLFSSRMISS